MCNHLLSVTKNSDAGPYAFKARISGRKASEACPARGVKTIYAETEEDVRARAAEWIGQEDTVDGPSFFPRGIERDDQIKECTAGTDDIYLGASPCPRSE